MPIGRVYTAAQVCAGAFAETKRLTIGEGVETTLAARLGPGVGLGECRIYGRFPTIAGVC